MSKITRRVVVTGLSASVMLFGALGAVAADQTSVAITKRADGRLCETEVKMRVEDAINKMISAAEKRQGKPLSQSEKDEWLSNGWTDAREVVVRHYTFFD